MKKKYKDNPDKFYDVARKIIFDDLFTRELVNKYKSDLGTTFNTGNITMKNLLATSFQAAPSFAIVEDKRKVNLSRSVDKSVHYLKDEKIKRTGNFLAQKE